ncbi:MAG: hypothetical protein AABW80_03365 [Nanoarchaeota archaeon]
MVERKNKKAQTALWIIVIIGAIAIIILVFAFRGSPDGGIDAVREDNAESFITSCVGEAVKENAKKMLAGGGFINSENSISYNNISVAYLCKNEGYFKPCINQHLDLIGEINAEMKKNIEGDIENCFLNLQENLEKRNNDVKIGEMQFYVEMAPQRIFVNINREVEINGEASKKINSFNVETRSSLYDLADIAIIISNQEAQYCYFEYAGYMNLHPNFKITKNNLGDETKVYTIEDVISEEEMKIAIRSCAIPPGI